MEYKNAVEILTKLLENHELTEEEKEALMSAIGLLGWAALAKNRSRSRAIRTTRLV